MGRRTRHAVTYIAATLAAVGCLYGCGSVPQGASGNNTARHAITATPRSAAEDSLAGSYRSVRVSMNGWDAPAVTTTSSSVISTIAALLRELPARPPPTRECPAITVIYQLTLEPARSGQPAVIISTDGCSADAVSIGGRLQPTLWDQGDRMFLLARSLLRHETLPPARSSSCRIPGTETTGLSTLCQAKPKLAPRIPD